MENEIMAWDDPAFWSGMAFLVASKGLDEKSRQKIKLYAAILVDLLQGIR